MAARMILEGRVPYVDFYELNPPLVLYLNLLPASVARVLGVNPIPVFLSMVGALAVLSAWAFRRALLAPDLVSRRAAAALTAALACVTLVLFVRGDLEYDFGQREHLFVLVYAPFLAARWARWEGQGVSTPFAVGLGVAASVGACLKPQFVVTAAAVELCALLATRRWRALFAPEALAFAGVGVLYGAHLALLPAAIRHAMFARFAQAGRYYSVYDNPIATLWLRPGVQLGIALSALPVAAWIKERLPVWRFGLLLSTFTLVSAAFYFQQHKGWSYHALPVWAGAFLVLGLLLGEGASRVARQGRLVRRAAEVCCALAIAGAVAGMLTRSRTPERNAVRAALHDYSKPGEAVLFLSTSVWPQEPALLQEERRAGTRYYGAVMPIAFFDGRLAPGPDGRVPYRTRSEMSEEERLFLSELEEDVRTFRPRLVFLPVSALNQGCTPGFRISEYLARAGFMPALAGYQPVAAVGDFIVLRRPGA